MSHETNHCLHQCLEPESLIPLKLGFIKLVMVGDQEQFPATVTTTRMKAKNLDISSQCLKDWSTS